MKSILSLKPSTVFLIIALPIIVIAFMSLESITPQTIVVLATTEMILILGWLHVLGTTYFERSKELANVSLVFFRINSIIPIPVLSLLALPKELLQEFAWLLLIGLFYSWFAIFYSLYFVSKVIATFEQHRRVHLADYIGYFFLLWFLPIGVWVIQPKVNKLVVGGLTGR